MLSMERVENIDAAITLTDITYATKTNSCLLSYYYLQSSFISILMLAFSCHIYVKWLHRIIVVVASLANV